MRRTSAPDNAKTNAAPGKPRRQRSPVRKSMFSRSKSADASPEAQWQPIKGVMKITTLDESLHSKYGSSSKAGGTEGKRERIKFKNIEIREYNRTVGDNPSVSSGKLFVACDFPVVSLVSPPHLWLPCKCMQVLR